jgi:secreted trypsin-like serine protease
MRSLFSLSLWMMTCLLTPSAFAVLGGTPVSAGTYNQTVALVYQADPAGKGKIFCSGTLIGPHTVLTAAHCLVTPMNDNIPVGDKLIPHLGVYLGDSPSSSEIPYVRPTIMVSKVYVHSDFTSQSKTFAVNETTTSLF